MKNKKLLFGIILCFITSSLFSQGKKPSERKKEEEDKEIRSEVFNAKNPDFQATTCPEKWAVASAVVLNQEFNYSFHQKYQELIFTEIVRKRIVLNDKAAVKEFSEFYFLSNQTIGIKIIKKDGREVKVNLEGAVETGDEVPDFYTPFYNYNWKSMKIAIPDLEVGDIIDYFYYTENNIYGYGHQQGFEPFIFTLNGTYPIVKQKLDFTVDKGFYISFNSYNGAPQLTEGEPGENYRGKIRNSIKTYQLVDENRDKMDDVAWNYRYLTQPTIKFQVVYITRSKTSGSIFFNGELGKVKRKTNSKDVQNTVTNWLKQDYQLKHRNKYIKSYIRKNYKGNNARKIAEHAYEYYRYKFYDPEKGSMLNGIYFVNTMAEILAWKKINAEIIVATEKQYGHINDVLLIHEVKLALRVGGNSGFILYPCTHYTTMDYVDTDIDGTEAYAFQKKQGFKSFPVRRINLPESTAEDNTYNSNVQLTLSDDFKLITIERNNMLSGEFKNIYAPLALYSFDFKEEDAKKYEQYYRSPYSSGNKKKVQELKRKEKEEIKEKNKEILDVLKDIASDEFEIASFDDFELIETGRDKTKPVLKFRETFTVENIINKAGNNYIFSAGALIGSQLELEEEDFERDIDAYIDYAKSYTYNINVKIPEGYTIEGLEELNFNIDNASGAFIAKATFENNILNISSRKIFKKNQVSAANWQQMVDFLEAAYEFTQKKVILKKI